MMRITYYTFTLFAAALLVSGITACGKKDEKAPVPGAGAGINWMGYTEGLQKAKETGKPVLVDYYTTWCKYCIMMDEKTYTDPGVVEEVNNSFIAVKVNAEGAEKVVDNGAEMTEAELAAAKKVTGYPTIMFLNGNGETIDSLPGYSAPEDFKPVLTFISSGAYAQGITFPNYLESLKK